MDHKTDKKIYGFVRKIRIRLAVQKILEALQTALVTGTAAMLSLSLLSLLLPFPYARHLETAVLLLSVAAGILEGIWHAPDMMGAALAADKKGYKERISTALFLAGSDNPFAELQKKDALALLEGSKEGAGGSGQSGGFQIRKEFPYRISWKKAAVAVLLAACFVGSCFVDSPARRQAEETKLQKDRADAAVAHIEKLENGLEEELKEKLEELNGISDKEQSDIKQKEKVKKELSELKEQLEITKENLSKARTAKELLKEQERLAQKLEEAGSQMENQALADALRNAVQSAKQQQEESRRELQKDAEDALAQAEHGSAEEKKKAYEKLTDLASALGDDALQEAADNYRDAGFAGLDAAAVQSILAQAGSRLDGSHTFASGAASVNPDATATVSQPGQTSSNSNKNSGTSGNGKQNGTGSGTGKGQGNNHNSSQAGGSGTGKGTGSGAGSGSNGSGNGTGNGSGAGSGSGGRGKGSGTGWNYGSKRGQEGAAQTGESVTIPAGKTGDDANLTGKANGNQSSSYVQSDSSPAWAGSKVSYGSVSGEYRKKAYQKLDGASYPDSLKDQIRDYFSGLNQ